MNRVGSVLKAAVLALVATSLSALDPANVEMCIDAHVQNTVQPDIELMSGGGCSQLGYLCCEDCYDIWFYDYFWCKNHFPPGPGLQECLLDIAEDRDICEQGCYQGFGCNCAGWP